MRNRDLATWLHRLDSYANVEFRRARTLATVYRSAWRVAATCRMTSSTACISLGLRRRFDSFAVVLRVPADDAARRWATADADGEFELFPIPRARARVHQRTKSQQCGSAWFDVRPRISISPVRGSTFRLPRIRRALRDPQQLFTGRPPAAILTTAPAAPGASHANSTPSTTFAT